MTKMVEIMKSAGRPVTRLFFMASLALALTLFALPAMAYGPKVGQPAPDFCVTSADDEELTPASLRGKVALIFYDHRDKTKANGNLKDKLRKLLKNQPEAYKKVVVGLLIIDARDAWWPITLFWKEEFRKGAKQEGVEIYGDWDGKMLADYSMKENDTNTLVLDAEGIVRYFRAGEIDCETESVDVIRALDSAMQEAAKASASAASKTEGAAVAPPQAEEPAPKAEEPARAEEPAATPSPHAVVSPLQAGE